MRYLRHSLTGLFLAFLTLALLIYAGQILYSAVETRMSKDNAAPPARERVFAVNVVPVAFGQVVPVLTAFGEVQSNRMLELRVPMGGRVVALSDAFVDGGTVRAGQELLRIDPSKPQAALERAQNDLRDAEAETRDADTALSLAQEELAAAREQADLRARAFQRQADLQARGVGTAAQVETAELAEVSARQTMLSRKQSVAQAEARIEQAATRQARARIGLDQAERDLADTTLSAGFDGTLSEVSVVEGRLVSPNEKLGQLIDPAALEVAFRISTAQYVGLLDETGRVMQAPVRATLGGGGLDVQATGRISRASAATGAGQSGRLLFARLDSAPGFKPGDFVTVSVEEPPLDNVARLPASALDAGGTVLVLGAEDRLEVVPVTLLRRQGDDVLLRGAGLVGREVVSARTPLLGPGIRVRPLRQADGAGDPAPAGREMLVLSDERRTRLKEIITANTRMPEAAKARVLGLLDAREVPARLVERIETRSGG